MKDILFLTEIFDDKMSKLFQKMTGLLVLFSKLNFINFQNDKSMQILKLALLNILIAQCHFITNVAKHYVNCFHGFHFQKKSHLQINLK